MYDWILAQLTGDGAIANWASIGTIITIIVSALKYFKERNDEKSRASRNLYLELENTLQSIDYENYQDNFGYVNIVNKRGGQETVYFMNRRLNHDFYDSMIYSGKINFLEPFLQQKVQDAFKYIKIHNEFLTVVLNIPDTHADKAIPSKSHKYYELLERSEVYLRDEIPKIMEELQRYFKKRHRF